MLIDTELKTWGNSFGIRVTKAQAERLGLNRDDCLRVTLEKKKPKSAFGVCKGLAPFERDRDDRF